MAPSGMTGEQIYTNFYGGTGDDGRGLTASASTVNAVSQAYANRAESIMKLTQRMEASWQGDAAGAAQRGAAPLAVEHRLAAKDIDQTRAAINDQVNAFTTAKKNVIEVPATPKKPGFFDNVVTLGGANDSYEAKMARVNAANDTNLAAMTAYESQSSSARSGMPDFASNLQDDKASVGIQKPTPPPPPIGIEPPPGTGNPTRTGQNRPPGTSNPPGTNNQQFVGPHQTGGPDGPGNTNQTTPPQITTPGGFPGGPDRPGFPGGPGGPFGPNGPFGPGGQNGPGGTGGPGGPFGPVGSFGPGGSGGGPGSGGMRGFGPGGSGFGPGGSGSGAGGSGSGSGAGARGFGPGAGAAAAEGAAGRGGVGGVGAAGRGGAGGMGMGGGRGREGGEDGEHERPTYLVEPDPHDTFGTDEITAPPVIGE